MISGGRVVRDIPVSMIVLYYNIGKEDCVRVYASVMQPRRQLYIERRITLPLSLYCTFSTKRREKKRNPFHQAIPIYLTTHQPSSHHPTTESSMTLPSERPTPSQDHHQSPVHQQVTQESPTVLEPYTPQKAPSTWFTQPKHTNHSRKDVV